MFLLEATRGILPERVPVSLIAILAVWIILALPAVALPAAPEIFLEEEPETYLVIDKLEGMGFPPGLMTGDRGLEARVTVGEGGDESLSTFDAKVRLPLRRRPVILYVEGGGEDQSGSGFPSRWAWMGGIFLPSRVIPASGIATASIPTATSNRSSASTWAPMRGIFSSKRSISSFPPPTWNSMRISRSGISPGPQGKTQNESEPVCSCGGRKTGGMKQGLRSRGSPTKMAYRGRTARTCRSNCRCLTNTADTERRRGKH